MTALASPLIAGFENTDFIVNLQLSDLKNADAVRRARVDSGSSISWIVGHLLSYRCRALRACGVQRPNPYEEKFSFESPATDGSDYPDIAVLNQDWKDVHAELRDALSGLSRQQLLNEAPLPTLHDDRSLLRLLATNMWHEAYHAGVIGMLRVQWGYRHTHELAMEAMNQG